MSHIPNSSPLTTFRELALLPHSGGELPALFEDWYPWAHSIHIRDCWDENERPQMPFLEASVFPLRRTMVLVGAQTGVLLHLFPASLGWSSPRSPIFWFALSNHLQVALFSLSTWNWLPCVAVNICWQHWVPPSFFRSSFVYSVGEQEILLQFLHFRPQITHTQLFGLLTRADKGLGCTINFLIRMYHISVEVYWKFTGGTGY